MPALQIAIIIPEDGPSIAEAQKNLYELAKKHEITVPDDVTGAVKIGMYQRMAIGIMLGKIAVGELDVRKSSGKTK